MTWRSTTPGVVELPSGRLLRGHGRRHDRPPGAEPDFALRLGEPRPAPDPWPTRALAWPDFRLPRDRADARSAFVEALGRAGTERVEISCRGGVGRTGTALACIAVLDGVGPADAVAWIRERYHPHAVETPWQRRFVARFR